MKMQSVIIDIEIYMREDLGIQLHGRGVLERMFNEAQREVALELECVPASVEVSALGYLAETGATVDTVPDAYSIGSDDLSVLYFTAAPATAFIVGELVTGGSSGATGTVVEVRSTSIVYGTPAAGNFTAGETVTAPGGGSATVLYATADGYNGWLLTNDTRHESAYVTDTLPNNVTQGRTKVVLSRPITSQAAGDTVKVERMVKWIALPSYLIRAYFPRDGVSWNDNPMIPSSLPEIQELHRRSVSTGTPRLYALEEGMKRLWIYPQPSAAGSIRLSGVRRPVDCAQVATTSAGSSIGDTIITTNLPPSPAGHYAGVEIEIISGTAAPLGEVRRVSHSTSSTTASVTTTTFYFETPFSAQVASGLTIEILSLISDDFRDVISHYMRWKLLLSKRDFRAVAKDARDQYQRSLEDHRMQMLARNTSHGFSGGQSSRRGGQALVSNGGYVTWDIS